MKKSLILLGVIGIGYANAQSTEPYQGRVGVNTTQPSATLDVKSKTGTTNATKNLELQNANGTKLVTVLDNGKVGIGTESPTTALTIVDDDSDDQGRDNLIIRSYADPSNKADPHIIGHVGRNKKQSFYYKKRVYIDKYVRNRVPFSDPFGRDTITSNTRLYFYFYACSMVFQYYTQR